MKAMGPVFASLSHGNGIKIQKNSKNYKQFAKTQNY